ncbi:MAG: hypothetical protein KDK36_00780, partial [Leptospiraceae bacterium]|nr:hypothetical protein [Leptospiraceae bacterium]
DFAKQFFWGKGLAKSRLFPRPQEGSGEECGRASLQHFLGGGGLIQKLRKPSIFAKILLYGKVY